MAKKRRSYQVNSSDYNIAGGGGGASGGNVRFMQKDTTAVAGGGAGILYNPGTKNVARPIKMSLEAGLQVTNQQRTDSTVYFEHAFENTSVSASQVNAADELPSGYTTTLPSNMSIDVDTDSGDSDQGYVRIAQTTIDSNATAGTYKFRYKVDQGGWGASYIDYEIDVWPQGTTPTQTNSSVLFNQIIRNTTAKQYLTDTITGSQIVQMTLKDVSGFATGVEPKIETDGRVYVENVGDIVQASASHSFTVEVDLGQYGKFDFTYTENIAYGDPYGARYWGPANARVNANGNFGPLTMAQSDTYHNHAKSSGALRRKVNARDDTSPYLYGDGYGCEFTSNLYAYINDSYALNMSGYQGFGWMGPNGTDNVYWQSGSNYRVGRYRWEVPNGVTSICAVCVGGGSGGAYSWSNDGAGGAGLAWGNGITVTPGEILEIGVGLGRQSESSVSSYGGGPSWVGRYSQGGSGTTILFAQGGGYTGYTNNNPNGQSFNGYTIGGINYWQRGNSYNFNDSRDGGGYGINTSETSSVNGFQYGGGWGQRDDGSRIGGGAGGYMGNNSSYGSSQNGQYGGGGSSYYYSSTYGQGGGGGTGLDGQGARGAHTNSAPRSDTQAGSGYGGSNGSWTSYSEGSANYLGAGGGGSGGSRGNYGQSQYANSEIGGNRTRTGGLHGGGGGGSGTSWGGGNGGPGGVRIIWGTGADGTARSFPYTYCSEKPSMKYNGE